MKGKGRYVLLAAVVLLAGVVGGFDEQDKARTRENDQDARAALAAVQKADRAEARTVEAVAYLRGAQ